MKITSKLKLLAASAAIASVACFSFMAPSYAKIDCSDSNIPTEVREASGCNANSTSFSSAIVSILNAVIGIAGVVAVVFIIVGGINYMTSTADAGKVQKAKNTIFYALIGLLVCALSFAIVNWVIVGVLQGQ